MAEKNTSQVQQSAEGMKKLWEEQLARLGAAQEQTAKMEAQFMDQMQAAVDQSTAITKQAIAYTAQLTAEWRKLSLEAARRTTDLFSFKS